jgi:hypothetical protein
LDTGEFLFKTKRKASTEIMYDAASGPILRIIIIIRILIRIRIRNRIRVRIRRVSIEES